MFVAIEIRFGGNEATKKTQKTLLKQQYENFSASSTESLDFIFNRLQKIVSRLAILGVVITQEDFHSKFLRSLPPEWNTHVVVWMNKADIETMSIDDLYNNFKIVEQDVKKSVDASSSAQNLAFLTTPSTSISTANFSDNTVYAFMVDNPNGSNLPQHDLEQIHEDDLEAMDLKWRLSLLSMRAKRYFQRTEKKIFINANDTAGYDKSKVECFNFHKMGHFARECRAPRNKEGQFKYQHNTRKQGNNEDTSSKAMLAIDGVAFDWSDMTEEQVQTNMALMAFSDSDVYNDKTCAKTCLKNYETLKKQCDDLIECRARKEQRGTVQIFKDNTREARKTMKKHLQRLMLAIECVGLKREVACKDYEINMLKSEFEKVKQEKEGIEFKIEKFDNGSKSLNKLLENVSKENSDDSLLKEQVSEDTSSFVEYAEMYRSQSPRGNQRNWNGQKSNQLGSDFVMYNKACFICGSFDHVQAHCKYHQRERMVYGNNYNRVNYNYTTNTTHPNAQRNMVPRAVLMKTGLKLFNTARTVNTAHPKSIVFNAKPMSRFSKSAQSTVKRPYKSKTVLTNKKFNQKVNTAKVKVNTVRQKAVKTARPNFAVVNAVRGKPQQDDTGFIDNGYSRHMTRNIAYLSDFKEFDRDYVTFRGGAHGGRISGKGTLKTDSLDFEDVYFVNELKFNLFSISQMCDKKNNVLFTDTECLVLSPNLKLPDKIQILLKIPRKDNMYSFDMKNIVPKESLTCLVAKATSDESMLWHKRLGHINFKNINKLVKDNLVRGLPTKHFENDQTYVAFLKGKQHRASSKRRNRTLIEAARTMLADSKLPTTFWAEAVSTACYASRLQKCEVSLLDILEVVKHIGYNTRTEVAAGTITNESAGAQGEINAATSTQKEEISQDCIMMPIWKDASYFDSPSKDVGNVEPKSATDDQKHYEEEVNTAGQHVNTASPEVNTGRFKLNTVDPSVNITSSSDPDSPKDMFTMGASHTLKVTHVKFFSDEDEPEVDLGNIFNSYTVPITPNTRIHKDHPIQYVIG
ncbi:ribonuclease H-like domain-containing protein [Tanacetum coccineum]